MAKRIALVYIGAGNANFGGGEGPWDHASRFERIAGVTCAGVADADLAKARRAIKARQAGPHADAWTSARPFADWRAMLDVVRPDAAIVALPPAAHGELTEPGDLELELARRGIPFLLEKPLGVSDPQTLQRIAEELAARSVIVSVGYMFRYSAAVARMRELIDEAPGGPRVFLARYNCAYSDIAKSAWWDIRHSGGPIIEQATHVLDLARYLCGDIQIESVAARHIAATKAAGMLTDVPVDESGVPIDAGIHPNYRIARATVAHWRYGSGALGTLTHAVFLHGRKYEAEVEVWCDGLRVALEDPYGRCRLAVRAGRSDKTEYLTLDGDDMYRAEAEAFIEAIRTGSATAVRCRYADALDTHRLAWRITKAAEQRGDY